MKGEVLDPETDSPTTDAMFDLKGYAQSTQWIKSVLNATAFSQNLALLVTVLKDGESQMFYWTLIYLLVVAVSLQVIIAGIIVYYSTIPTHNVSPETCDNLKWLNWILMMFTTVSLMLNIAVNVIFSARAEKVAVAKTEL